jgi:hypothetical protein
MESNFNGTLYTKTNNSNLPCHTTDPQGRGRGGWGWTVRGLGGVGGEAIAENLASSSHCLRLWARPIYRAILLVSADLIQPIPIIIGVGHIGIGHVRTIDTKDTDLWCRPY